MKRKNLAWLLLAALAFLPGCDMEYVSGPQGLTSGGGGEPAVITSPDHNYLSITGLPSNAQEFNISNVFIWNQAGKIGECEDYAKIAVSRSGSSSALGIPLWYTGFDTKFAETGTYFISFDLNIDALTRIKISEKEKVTAAFLNGNGVLDAATLPEAATRYFTVTGLPPNTPNNGFSGVYLSNAAGRVAKCAGYDDIVVSGSGAQATAFIPMVYTADSSDPFRNTGTFIIEFSVNIDAYTQVYITSDTLFTADFTDGAGTFDMMDFLGYFNGSFTNPNDALIPVVARNTEFEMNGSYYKVDYDTVLPAVSLERTSLVYAYAVPIPGGFSFECSTEEPVFSATKNGYYRGNARALYKFVYIRDIVNRHVAKTTMTSGFTQFAYYASGDSLVGQPPDSSIVYTLSGTGNPVPQNVTLSPGAYGVVLKGAGGGGGGSAISVTYPGGQGGDGGYIAEVFTLNKAAAFTAYTGEGGGVTPGGGGAGTFLYAPAGYFLCAGGGGGGTSGTISFLIAAVSSGGGAGGSVGNGGNGGGATLSGPPDIYTPGGTGGGYPFTLYSTGSGYQGFAPNNNTGVLGIPEDGKPAAYAAYTQFLDIWKNTNNANGQGGNGVYSGSSGAKGNPGGDGGNNRNTLRGGGAGGGAAGYFEGDFLNGVPHPSEPGESGSITIYSLNQ
jgi:hypothetical protein